MSSRIKSINLQNEKRVRFIPRLTGQRRVFQNPSGCLAKVSS